MDCSNGKAIQVIHENGTLGCTDVYDGDITTVTVNDGLLGGGTNGDISLSVDFSTVQMRSASMECASGSYVQSIFANGTVGCKPDENSGGDITSITVSTGLTGSATSGDASLGIDYNTVQQRVGSSCTAGSSIRVINNDGTVECELDNDSGGDITSVIASNGLIGGGQVGALSISANTSYLQKRIINSCDVGSSIRSINEDGSVSCEIDTDSGGDITSIITNNGIIGGSTSGDVSLSINTSYVQNRVVGKCDTG